MIKTLLFLAVVGLIEGGRLTEPHPDCPFREHHLLPHEYDCTKFYYCEWGEKHIEPRDCAPGTEFSFQDQVCTHPFLANCNLPPAPGPSTTTTPEPIRTTTTETPVVTTPEPIQTTTTETPVVTTPEPIQTTTTEEPVVTTPEPIQTTTTEEPVVTTARPIPTTTETQTTKETTTEWTTHSPTELPTSPTQGTTEDDCDYLENGCPVDFNVHKLLPHETSCRSFYYCVHGEKQLRRCPRETIFDPEEQVCVHPYQTNRSCEDDSSSSGEPDDNDDKSPEIDGLLPNGCPANFSISGYLPHERYCNLFYQCNFGQLVERRCPEGTHFNPDVSVCDHPFNVRCTLPGGEAPLPDTTTTTTTTRRPPTEFFPNGCPTDGSDWLLPHEDCTKFYSCVWGSKIEMDCPGGTHFNPTEQICDNPATAGCRKCDSGNDCDNNPVTPEPTTETTIITTTTSQPTNSPPVDTTTSNGPSQGTTEDDCDYLENGCPVDFNVHKLLPHETSCRSFYYCVHGEKQLRRCPRETIFDPKEQVCVHPYQTDRSCEDDLSSSGEPDDNDDKSPEIDGLLPNGCPANFSISGYLPHERYCNLFYQCNFGQLVERRCPEGTHFNPDVSVCDHPFNVRCTLPGGEAPLPDTTTTTTTTRRPPTEFFPNGCPTDGSDWLLPHEDCTRFYYCVWGQKVEMLCPGGTHFNPTEQICDNPATAGCIKCVTNCPGTTEPAPEITDPAPEVTDPAPEVTDPAPEVTEPAPEVTEPAPEVTEPAPEVTEPAPEVTEPAPEVTEPEDYNWCAEDCNTMPEAHEDCDKYWICDRHRKFLIVCAEGLHFNPATYTCDFPCNAGCVRNSIQTTSNHDGIKIYLPWHKIDENTATLLKDIIN